MNSIYALAIGFIAATLFTMSLDIAHLKQDFEAVNHVHNGELQK